jgi:hypothetical protein
MATKTLALEIINVGTPVHTKTARGGYNSLELAYKNHSFEGKVEGKKIVDFNDKQVFQFLQGLKQGDHITVTAEKGETDQFWKWAAVEKSDGSGAAGTPSVPSSDGESASGEQHVPSTGGSRHATGRVVGNTYETPEERALRRTFDKVKHRQIGRQGCINSAIAILNSDKTSNGFSVEEVVEVAKELEQFVFTMAEGDIPF